MVSKNSLLQKFCSGLETISFCLTLSVCSFRAFYLDKSNLPPNSTSKAAYIDKVNKNIKCLINLCMLHTLLLRLSLFQQKLNRLYLGGERHACNIFSHLCFLGQVVPCGSVLKGGAGGSLCLRRGIITFLFHYAFRAMQMLQEHAGQGETGAGRNSLF